MGFTQIIIQLTKVTTTHNLNDPTTPPATPLYQSSKPIEYVFTTFLTFIHFTFKPQIEHQTIIHHEIRFHNKIKPTIHIIIPIHHQQHQLLESQHKLLTLPHHKNELHNKQQPNTLSTTQIQNIQKSKKQQIRIRKPKNQYKNTTNKTIKSFRPQTTTTSTNWTTI